MIIIHDYDAASEYDKTKEPSIKKVSQVQLFRRRWQIRRLSHFSFPDPGLDIARFTISFIYF